MSAVEDIAEITPYQGMRYTRRLFVVDAANEARLMGHCRIDPATFRSAADPSAFISFAIQEGVRNGISSNGGVNMVQGLVQSRPLRLDEKLTVTGEILKVEDSPRGRVTTSETWYHGENGELGITSHPVRYSGLDGAHVGKSQALHFPHAPSHGGFVTR